MPIENQYRAPGVAVKWLLLNCILLALLFPACKQSSPGFTSLPASKTKIDFSNNLEKRKLLNILYYLYYYNGGGVATGDINNDGLTDIYFTANSKGKNKLYLNKGNFEFEDITDKAGVAGTADWCSGVTMADVNGDGYLDIYVSAVSQHHGLKGRNELFINNGLANAGKATGGEGNPRFTESAVGYGLGFSGFSTQTAFFDYDRDGDLDCYILNHSQRPNAHIVDTINRHSYDSLAGDRLYQNNLNGAAGKFTDVTTAAGIYQSSLGFGLGLAIGDINNDGWDDIYVGNDFHENDYYYVNNGNAPSRGGGSLGEVSFTESGAKYFDHYSRFSMGNDLADYNNDGHLDLVTADMLPRDEKVLKTYGSDENPDIFRFKLMKNGYQYQYSKNCLQRNNGNGTSFSETSLLSNVPATDWSWSPLFADFDNDGNKDLFVSSGIVKRPVDLDFIRFISNISMKAALNETDAYDDESIEKMPDGSSHPFLFKGDGKLSFKDVSPDWGTGKMKGYYTGAAYADLDNDGKLDLVINSLNAPAVILKNNLPKKNYITVAFRSDSLNRFGIGARAYIYQNGKMQYQQLMPTRGFQSSSDLRLHFGLDSVAHIDSILLIWPNQQYQVIRNIVGNKLLVVNQKDASGAFNYAAWFPLPPALFANITDKIKVNWKHRENEFNDYDVQYLIPHAESTRGPKIAVADLNGDGLDDFYACGAKGQARSLMIQQRNGSFVATDTAVFNRDNACEDVDALFFDADANGSMDLYIVSGGNELTGNAEPLKDRLYLNDGKGHFQKAENSLPPVFENKSCVSVADIDHDGDNDIFVGGFAKANAYGIPISSHLLLNDGKAHFSVAGEGIIALADIGMVTTAAFADINKDGWKDLIVTGEWMPLTIFINRKGTFQQSVIENSTGLWQTVFMDDVNGDGYLDMLAGNWGWNNKFHSGKNGPLKMYVADFDLNGKTDQLLSYTMDGQEYPFLAKDEVERSLPLLKKHYLLYADYAGVPMKDVFYGWIDTVRPLIAERLGSVIGYGNGKGHFELQDLPAELQLAPIFSFQVAKIVSPAEKNYLAGGNFFDVIPYEGRYDAQPLTLFSISKNKTVQYIHQPGLSAAKGQFRDLKWIRTAGNGKMLAAARNNEPLLFYGYMK